jgi:hypothetical protein
VKTSKAHGRPRPLTNAYAGTTSVRTGLRQGGRSSAKVGLIETRNMLTGSEGLISSVLASDALLGVSSRC